MICHCLGLHDPKKQTRGKILVFSQTKAGEAESESSKSGVQTGFHPSLSLTTPSCIRGEIKFARTCAQNLLINLLLDMHSFRMISDSVHV